MYADLESVITWIVANRGNLVVGILLCMALFFAVRAIIRSRRSGKGCGGNCSGCSGCCPRKDKDR